MFHRDTLRLIKKTYKRFLTIFLMVLIGVAFMVGLMSSSPTMQYSVDEYYKETNYMDIQLYSSYGFNDNDIKNIKATSGIRDVFATRFQDVYGTNEDGVEYVTRVQEIDSNVNKVELVAGRLPSKAGEAVSLDSSSFGSYFKIGDKVVLSLDDDTLDEKIKYQEYTIVGEVKSPQYMTSTKETSTLDNLALEAIIYVDNDDLLSEYYTSVYITLEGSEDVLAFSDDYDTLYDERIVGITSRFDTLEEELKSEIIEDATKELEDAQTTLDENKQKAEDEFADAEKELNDAYIEILVGESQLESTKLQISMTESELKANEALLDSSKAALDDAVKTIEDTTGMSFDEAYNQISTLYDTYLAITSQKDNIASTNEMLKEEIAANDAKIAELNAELLTLDPFNDAERYQEILDEIAALESSNALLEELIKENNEDNYDALLAELDAKANGSVLDSYANIKKVKDGLSEIEDGYASLEAAKKELSMTKDLLNDSQSQLSNGKRQYENGVQELNKNRYEVNKELEDAQLEIDKGYQDLEELPDAGWTILGRDMQYSPLMYENTLGQMTNIANIFPLLFFLVAALVSMTTMTRLIEEERSQIGVFSALGFSKNKIISKYLLYALIASVFASFIGIFAGLPIFPVVIYNTWRLMYDLPAMHVILLPHIAIIGALSFTLLILLVTYIVGYRTLKEMPSQLMRPKAPKSAKKVIFEYIKPLWNHLSFTSKITARNLVRYKSRFFMTVIGVAGCMSLLVLGFGIKDAIADVIEIQFGEIFKYNYSVNMDDDYYTDSVYEVLLEDSNNEQVVPYMEYSSLITLADDEETISVEVYDERQIDRVIDLRDCNTKEPLSISDGVVISEKFAKNNDIKVGDVITMESKSGLKGEVLVTGITEMYFEHYLFISDELYENTFNETVRNDALAVIAKDGERLINDMEEKEGVLNVIDFSSMIEQFETMISALDFIILVIILASGSLAFVVLVNLTEVNISERLREIATLKVLGFNNKEVNGYIFKELFLLTIFGAILGMPLGKMEQRLVMTVIDMEMVMFGNNIRPISYLYSFAITLAFALIVMLFMSRQLRKIQMVESLKSVE